jgi:cytochrome P450
MTQTTVDGTDSMAVFNPLAEGFIDDPYQHYAWLRAHEPIYFHSTLNAWLITGYHDINDMLRNNDLGRGEQMRFFGHIEAGSSIDLMSRSWVFVLDPPDHTRVRCLFATAFTNRCIRALRPYIEATVDDLLTRLAADGGGDFIEQVAQLLPISVICHLLGIPESDHAIFRTYSSAIFPLFDPMITPEQLRQADKAAAWFLDYFHRLVEQRRHDPRDDLVSALLATVENGQSLTPDELVNNVIFLFGAGHETTVGTLGNGLVALLRHPDQFALLRENPALLPNAVLEMLRWDSPVQYVGRRATVGMEINGIAIKKDQILMGLLGAGNRDPERFAEPDRFDITRVDCQPLSFGAGIHYCMGAALSRLETEVFFEKLIDRFPGISMPTRPLRRELFALRSYANLTVEI